MSKRLPERYFVTRQNLVVLLRILRLGLLRESPRSISVKLLLELMTLDSFLRLSLSFFLSYLLSLSPHYIAVSPTCPTHNSNLLYHVNIRLSLSITDSHGHTHPFNHTVSLFLTLSLSLFLFQSHVQTLFLSLNPSLYDVRTNVCIVSTPFSTPTLTPKHQLLLSLFNSLSLLPLYTHTHPY